MRAASAMNRRIRPAGPHLRSRGRLP